MNQKHQHVFGLALLLSTFAVGASLVACGKPVPQDIIQAVESIDRSLLQLRAAELAPHDYGSFARKWATLRTRAEVEEDLIHWPWESNTLELDLRQLQEEGSRTVARLTERQAALRRSAEQQLVHTTDRASLITHQVRAIDGRIVLGNKPVETDLLLKQAQSFYERGHYIKSLDASNRASRNLAAEAALLTHELGRYANPDRIARWQQLAKDTIAWSKSHHASAIVVSKADRTLTLYKDGRKVLSYPVRLGFNGIREKRHQGDGATPEGRYRVIRKRGQGQTQFYRALVLDYPNQEDRRRFAAERKAGHMSPTRSIGGQIEIHGVENELIAQTLGCVMLENPQIALLFERVDQGTPVTIVGALHENNAVALALASLTPMKTDT
ncbi:MAG TPA: L,D-transpeptidase [Nitrospira sp.]